MTRNFRRLVLIALFCFIAGAGMAQSDYNFDRQSWSNLTAIEQQKVIENLKFDMLHERNDELQKNIDELISFNRSNRAQLTTANLLKIPLRTGKLEVKAFFKKAKGEIRVCTPTRIEAVLDTYRLVATADPANPGKVFATLTGDDPNIPAEPVVGTITTNGKTAKITAGSDWIELTYEGKNSYTCRTNKVPVKISAKFID